MVNAHFVFPAFVTHLLLGLANTWKARFTYCYFRKICYITVSSVQFGDVRFWAY